MGQIIIDTRDPSHIRQLLIDMAINISSEMEEIESRLGSQAQPPAHPGFQGEREQSAPPAHPGFQGEREQSAPPAHPGSQGGQGQAQPQAHPGSQGEQGQAQPQAHPGFQGEQGHAQPPAHPGSQGEQGQAQPHAHPGFQGEREQSAPPAHPGFQGEREQSAPPAHPGSQANLGTEVDSDGLPWDARIHADSRNKTKTGKWSAKRGVDEQLKSQVIAELRGRQSQHAQPQGLDWPTVCRRVNQAQMQGLIDLNKAAAFYQRHGLQNGYPDLSKHPSLWQEFLTEQGV